MTIPIVFGGDSYPGHPRIPDRAALLPVKGVLAMSRQQEKIPPIPNVMDIRPSRLLPPRPNVFRDIDPILPNQFPINFLGNLPLGDHPLDIEPIPMPQVAGGDLVDKAFERCGDAVVHIGVMEDMLGIVPLILNATGPVKFSSKRSSA